MMKKASLLCLLVSGLLMQTVCSTESNDTATRVDQNREGSTKDSSAIVKTSEIQTPRIDPFQQVVNPGTYFEYFGLMRPANASDVERIGYKGDKNIPGLIVFAREHPALARPRLSVQTLEGEPALVLTFLSFDISQGTLTEEIPMVCAAGVYGPIPKQFVVRWVASSEEFEAPLRQVEGESIALQAEAVAASEGPGVSFAPWATPLVYTQFFEQLGLPDRPEMTDVNFAVAVKPTASGEQSAAASATSLAGGGTRLKIHIPIDPGGSLWGPRSGEAANLYTYAAGQGSIECLIEL